MDLDVAHPLDHAIDVLRRDLDERELRVDIDGADDVARDVRLARDGADDVARPHAGVPPRIHEEPHHRAVDARRRGRFRHGFDGDRLAAGRETRSRGGDLRHVDAGLFRELLDERQIRLEPFLS